MVPTCIALVLTIPIAAENEGAGKLRDSLTFHAGFDGTFDADFAKGDKRLYTSATADRRDAKPGNQRNDITLIDNGRFGGAMRFGDAAKQVVFYRGEQNVPYSKDGFAGTVAFWLRLDPQVDLKPGYCDPIQVTDKTWNDACLFVDFTKDDVPRHFRLGVFSDYKFWNPKDVKWDDIAVQDRPMVVVQKPPFARERWTHVAFTYTGFNAGGKQHEATLYLDGKSQGSLKRAQQFTWDPARSAILLGLSYIGDFDDLVVFGRDLTPAEIAQLHGLQGGVRSLHGKETAR